MATSKRTLDPLSRPEVKIVLKDALEALYRPGVAGLERWEAELEFRRAWNSTLDRYWLVAERVAGGNDSVERARIAFAAGHVDGPATEAVRLAVQSDPNGRRIVKRLRQLHAEREGPELCTEPEEGRPQPARPKGRPHIPRLHDGVCRAVLQLRGQWPARGLDVDHEATPCDTRDQCVIIDPHNFDESGMLLVRRFPRWTWEDIAVLARKILPDDGRLPQPTADYFKKLWRELPPAIGIVVASDSEQSNARRPRVAVREGLETVENWKRRLKDYLERWRPFTDPGNARREIERFVGYYFPEVEFTVRLPFE